LYSCHHQEGYDNCRLLASGLSHTGKKLGDEQIPEESILFSKEGFHLKLQKEEIYI
jgi:hypothetical protein